MARKRAQAYLVAGRGKRTGVQVFSQTEEVSTEMEDLDAAFATAASPQPSGKENQEDEERTPPPTVVKPQPERRQKELRFSVGGAEDADESIASASKVKGMLKKLSRQAARGSLSPSELSKVSTAPPSETRSVPGEVDDMEQVRHMDMAADDDDDGGRVATPMAQTTQESRLQLHDDDDDDLMVPPPPPDEDDDMIPPPVDSPGAAELPEEADAETPTQQVDDIPELPAAEASPPPDDTPKEVPTQVPEPQEEEEIPTQGPEDFDDSDDDKEGAGFQMADGPVSPESVPEDPPQPKPKKTKKARKLPKASQQESEDGETVKTRKTRGQKKKPKRNAHFSPKGFQTGPREFTSIPVTDTKETPEGAKGRRRSKRTRIKPLEYWRNERPEYGPNDFPDEMCEFGLTNMPVIKAYAQSQPTPYKKRKVAFREPVMAKKSAPAQPLPSDQELDRSKLRHKYEIQDDDTAYLWDDCYDVPANLHVIGYKDELPARQLPMTAQRKRGEGKVCGVASQAFNVSTEKNPFYPGYIMGNLTLPPKGIKDAESVGSCAQTFTVVFGQPKALEVAYGDPDNEEGALIPETAQRFLLSPGDMFRVPPGNCYRIQNHSKETDSFLTWTIIRANHGVSDHSE